MPHYSSKKLPIENVFRDPVHNYIYVQEEVILDLINSKEFQRLRRIKQLGTTSFTFHGGEHSRFSHSLGVYEIARRISDLFERNYSKEQYTNGWDSNERLVLLVAALLHDVGHGAYSHTFETIFHTNHEEYTIKIIMSPETEINKILARVHPDFPAAIASVIDKSYPNPQVVQLISSQVDADRMDYLLRDAYFTGTEYGMFDLTRILRVIRPYADGIAFQMNGMHAVEDYIVSRYQMYMQVYFHPVSRGMEVILDHLLKRGQELFRDDPSYFAKTSPLLIPFFEGNPTLKDYLKVDDGVLTTYFSEWEESPDAILNDLAKRFMNRHPFKSAKFIEGKDDATLTHLTDLIEEVGFDTRYYTAINTSFDLPYDFYRPEKVHSRTQIELIEKDGSLFELSTCSDLVNALAGEIKGDERFYFPREMLPNTKTQTTLFDDISIDFGNCIRNGSLVSTSEEGNTV